jgi:hypothetical protein
MDNKRFRELAELVNTGTATVFDEFLYEQEKLVRESAPNVLMTAKPNIFHKLGRSADDKDTQ